MMILYVIMSKIVSVQVMNKIAKRTVTYLHETSCMSAQQNCYAELQHLIDIISH